MSQFLKKNVNKVIIAHRLQYRQRRHIGGGGTQRFPPVCPTRYESSQELNQINPADFDGSDSIKEFRK